MNKNKLTGGEGLHRNIIIIYGVYIKRGGFPGKKPNRLKKNKERYKSDFYLNNCFLMGTTPTLK